jgi:phenylalanyl-tRNA synthetase alpha chain
VSWKSSIESLKSEINDYKVNNANELEAFRISFLGTKGKMKDAMSLMGSLPVEEKKIYGQAVNEVKKLAEEKWQTAKDQFELQPKKATKQIDISATAFKKNMGTAHPITLVRRKIVSIFERIGFVVAEGPEIEDDWHNFTALNTPKDHPARDMQDTFFLTQDKEYLLRTHTSSTQIRSLENEKLPLRIITPGRVFRNETISARAHCTFHQVEGLYVDEGVSFADLKQVIYYFAKEMFGSENVRFRPSFFPFTEPSAEIDISCFICDQKGCNVCKKTGWVEIGGCGMVDPNVLKNCNIDTTKYNGFAFGMGIERIAMLQYQINDIRLFWQNDMRFLQQFKGEVL